MRNSYLLQMSKPIKEFEKRLETTVETKLKDSDQNKIEDDMDDEEMFADQYIEPQVEEFKETSNENEPNLDFSDDDLFN